MSTTRNVLAAAALALVPLLALANTAETTGKDEKQPQTGIASTYEKAKGEIRDAYIAGRLITAYALSEHLSPFTVGVDVKDRIVTLNGTVESDVLRDLAIEIARGVEDVGDVKSEIKVEPNVPRKTPAAQDTFTRRFADATITARVKTRLLWNGSTHGLSVNVDTAHEVVRLSGTVKSSAERELAGMIALNTKGVERVENRLHVEPEKAAQK